MIFSAMAAKSDSARRNSFSGISLTSNWPRPRASNRCHPCEHRNVADKMALADDREFVLLSSPREVSLSLTAQDNKHA
jgi:hypothetical protein